MKFKPSYGDKQRERQKQNKEQNAQNQHIKPAADGKSVPAENQPQANETVPLEKRTA